MTYEIVSTDSTPYGSEFYLSIGDDSQEFQELPRDFSVVYRVAENKFCELLDDTYGEISVPHLGTYGAGELFYRLASETDRRIYIGDYAAQLYEEVDFIKALNATQEETDWRLLVPEPEPGEPDNALELLVDLDQGQDTRVVVELSPRGVRYRLPRELGTYKGSRREWHRVDTSAWALTPTLTELLDEIYDELSE